MFEVSSSELETLSLDHHGIVAGICRELKLAERINEKIKFHEERVLSPGQAVVSMILNGLGFTNRRL